MQVRAITVSAEAREEANQDSTYLQRCPSTLLDEEVFIAQLFRRAKLLNNSFFEKILQILWSHAVPDHAKASPTCLNADPSLHSERNLDSALRDKAESSTIQADAVTVSTVFAALDGNSTMQQYFQLTPLLDPAYLFRTNSSTLSNVDRSTEISSNENLRLEVITCRLHERLMTLELHAAPVKTVSRMRQKLVEYSSENYSWPLAANILDPIRCSIVCDSPREMLEVVRRVCISLLICIITVDFLLFCASASLS